MLRIYDKLRILTSQFLFALGIPNNLATHLLDNLWRDEDLARLLVSLCDWNGRLDFLRKFTSVKNEPNLFICIFRGFDVDGLFHLDRFSYRQRIQILRRIPNDYGLLCNGIDANALQIFVGLIEPLVRRIRIHVAYCLALPSAKGIERHVRRAQDNAFTSIIGLKKIKLFVRKFFSCDEESDIPGLNPFNHLRL